MAKVDTNVVRLAYAREAAGAPGVRVGAGARVIEPNEITSFGATVTTVVREPISDRLQRRKGTPTDLDSEAAFGMDITVDALLDWVEGAIFATGFNHTVRELAVASAATAADRYTLVNNLVAAQNAKLPGGALVWAWGFVAPSNNGLKHLDAATTTDDAVSVDENLTDVTGGSATAPAGFLGLAGLRLASAEATSWTWNAANKQATLVVSNAGGTKLRAMLAPGMAVHLGSVTSVGAALDNGLTVAGAEEFGFARVVSINTAGTSVVFDRVAVGLQGTVAAIGADLDIVAGDFFRNVPRSDAAYVQRSHTIELTSPELGSGGGNTDDGYEYGLGQVVSTLALNFPLTDKATMTVNFVGEDTEKPATVRQTGFDTALEPRRNEAFNTSADFARLRLLDADEDGITTDFKSMTVTLNPQVAAEKVIGRVGAAYINRGNLLVDAESQVVFTDPGVPNAIRDNATVSFEAVIGNNDGVFVLDIPSATVSGGGREFPTNEAVLLNAAQQGFEDELFQTSIGVSFMPVPIPTE